MLGSVASNNYLSINKNIYKKMDGEKIKRDPTEEQLKHIEESQAREKEWLSEENHQLVPIDWDYVKETINLTEEERNLRHKQDLKEIYDKYDAEMDMHEKNYRDEIAKIDAQGEINQKKIDESNRAKAMAIIAEVRNGNMVSPFDMMFAQDVAPEELAKAVEDAKKLKEQSPYGDMTNIMSIINIKA